MHSMGENWTLLDDWFDRYFHEVVAAIEGGIDPSGAGDKLVTDGDATDHEGNILTDGDFKVQSIGDKALFELQTRSDLLNNSAYSVPGVPTFDSVSVTIDSSLDMSVV